jgi:hypothetical protein
MKTAVDFVRTNITIRKSSFSTNPQLFDSIIFSDSIDSYNLEMLKNISSKSFIGNGYIVNRLKGLEYLLNGLNFKTGEKFKNFDLVKHAHPFIISCYILAGQVFSDANHRVVMQYLNSMGYSYSRSIKYIEMIDNARRTKCLSWENISEFVQTLISNIVYVEGDIEINKKIENMFI